MSVVVIDDATRAKLLAADSTVVEVRDETGAVVGRFVRQVNLADYEPIDVPFTDEEIERHKRESPRYTAEQVEDRLRRLRKCE
jgi:hypothetical protein